MIPKLNSNEFNDLLLSSFDKIENCLANHDTTVENIKKKTGIMLHEFEYAKYLFDKNGAHVCGVPELNLSDSERHEHYKVFLLKDSDEKLSRCSKFGCSVHSAFIGEPTNIFNLKTSESDKYYFRNDAAVYINKSTEEAYNDILKHDTLDKKIFFQEFDTDTISVEIRLPDASRQLGPTIFNTIEIDSFLVGSYDIESIIIKNAYGDETTIDLKYITNDDEIDDIIFYNSGKIRIALSERYNFQTLIINCKIKYSTESKLNASNSVVYPFGIKHIYLYNANYNQYKVNSDGKKEITSYAIYKVKLPTGENLNTINQDILIKSTTGAIRKTTAEIEGIKFYINYEDKDTTIELPTSKLDENPYGPDITEFYIKIPLVDIGINDNIKNKNIVAIGVDYTTR